MPSTSHETELSPPSAAGSPPLPRRAWFPPAWVGLLVGICAWFWNADVDPGLSNTVNYLAVAVGVVGLALWTIRRSGWPRKVRWSLALTPTALVAAYFLQLLPVKSLNNGAAGIVGWQWRWADPDRALETPTAPTGVELAVQETPQDYPRFLGAGYWAEARGVELDPDWKSRPPRELWRRPIGAGWSSFAVVGDYGVTQEQRDDEELVACYDLRTGDIAWTHADHVRWDPGGAGALGYAGPRATPTIDRGLVFAQGATGILNCLELATGKLRWSHDTLAEHETPNIMWGKAGSPLVVDDRVVVSVGGADDCSLVAYDVATGKQAWAAGTRRSSYASPVLATLAGERLILSVDEGFVTAHSPTSGEVLWEHPWESESDSASATSQPVPVGDDRILLSMGYGRGAELFRVTRDGSGAWSTETLWKNPAVLKTKFSNVLVRDGYVYGLDDVFLQCVELETGQAKWKKRRSPSFGYGQVLLVGAHLLVVTEEGEVVLAEASPQKYRELASMSAVEGITWNNPVLTGSRLLVRNAEEAACFDLPLRKQGDRSR